MSYLLVIMLVVGCGGAGVDPEAVEAERSVMGLLDRLPSETRYVAAVDVPAMLAALELDRDDLRTPEPPPVVDPAGQFDPRARALGALRSTAVPALLSPFTSTFAFLDLGAIEAGVYAFEIGDGRWAALTATAQPASDLEQGLADDGFVAQGSGRWVFPDQGEQDDTAGDGPADLLPSNDPTGGFPAVLVEPGLFVMASSTDALETVVEADGINPALRALVDGAGASWGFAAFVFEPDLDPSVCQEGAMALAIHGAAQVEALVLGGGDDVFARDHPVLTVEAPSVVSEVTRYQVATGSDGPPEDLVFNTLLDSASFAAC